MGKSKIEEIMNQEFPTLQAAANVPCDDNEALNEPASVELFPPKATVSSDPKKKRLQVRGQYRELLSAGGIDVEKMTTPKEDTLTVDSVSIDPPPFQPAPGGGSGG